MKPSVRIDVSAGGAGKGIADCLAGLVDLGMVSRELTPDETAQGAVFLPVARDATFAILSAANPARAEVVRRGLTRTLARDLWTGEERPRWGRLAGGGDTTEIRVFTRSDSCGAAEVWAGFLGGKQADLGGIGVYGDPGIAEAVRKDARAIGYGNLGYVFDARTGLPVEGLDVIPLDGNENGRIDPGEDVSTRARAVEAIRSGAYPAPPARELFLVARGRFIGPTATFVAWILADGQRFVDPAGYVQLGEARLQEARRTLSR